jgi:hypothetical protein
MWVVTHFGRVFSKLIWSPWLAAAKIIFGAADIFLASTPGLPDGIFSNQKFKFG